MATYRIITAEEREAERLAAERAAQISQLRAELDARARALAILQATDAGAEEIEAVKEEIRQIVDALREVEAGAQTA